MRLTPPGQKRIMAVPAAFRGTSTDSGSAGGIRWSTIAAREALCPMGSAILPDQKECAMAWRLKIDEAIERYELADHVAELEDRGATLIPPERAGITPTMVHDAREALLAHARRKTGADWDVDKGPLHSLAQPGRPGYFFMTRMLEVHPVFLALQFNDVMNTLHRVILGDEFRLCTSNGFLKWADPEGSWGPSHGMHTDSPLVRPAGFGYAANCNWLLTDYTVDDGPICFIPGTHRRETRPTRVSQEDLDGVVGVEGPAGSLFIFHGSLWHGSLPRRNPGLRLSTHSQRRIPAITPLWDFSDVDEAFIQSSQDPALLKMLCWKDDPIFLKTADEVPRIPTRADQHG